MAGKTTAAGYGGPHQRLRRMWAQIVDAGGATCARCGRAIAPGSRWHLDHADDRRGYIGVSHSYCNTTAPNRRRGRRRYAQPARDWTDGT